MAESNSSTAPETAADPAVRFVVDTPTGFQNVDGAELPADLRERMISSLDQEDMPPAFKRAITAALGGNQTDRTDAANGAESDAAEVDGETVAHEEGCRCAVEQREQIWEILDTVFPNDPHLWQAMHTLFMVSGEVNPLMSEQDRLNGLAAATTHIQRRIDAESSAAPLAGPVEQIVDSFRAQMEQQLG